jgi:hypothetical protein
MKGPEDDAGLAGKVALISGGGAAGDGGVTLRGPERDSRDH